MLFALERRHALKRTWKVISSVGLLLLTWSTIAAQSKEMDRPTQLTSRETSAEWGPPPIVHYYTFGAGPGEFSILLAAGPNSGCSFGILDANYKQIGEETIWASESEQQKIDRFTLDKKGKVVLKVSCQQWYENNRTRSYHFRLSGAVDLPENSNK
jgi:hypothetical protein